MPTSLVSKRAFLEGPRWHDGVLYVSDMHGDVVLSVTEGGDVSNVVDVEQPSGLGWLPDGSLLISSMTRRAVMRYDGSGLTLHADLSSLASYEINDMCVDRHGHAFVGQFGYDMRGGAAPAAAPLLRVDPDGSAHEVADGLRMANGMVITADHSTLLVAESWGKCITAFDLASDGSLSNQVEGGQVERTVDTPGRHAIACAVGGADGGSLFMITATTHGERVESQTAMTAAVETAVI